MGNKTSSHDYTYDTLARDIIQVYQSHTIEKNKTPVRRGTRNGRPAVKRLISEDKWAKRREQQQSNRLTLSDMELVCDGEKCR